MAQVCFYNVEHGDYISIKTNNNISIIRDCGSLEKSAQAWLCNNLPNTLCGYKTAKTHEAIITHPHKDHYYGFEQMQNQYNGQKFFDTSYVPILYLGSSLQDITKLKSKQYNLSDLSLTALAVKVAITLQQYLPQGTKAPNPTNWLKVAPIMADLSHKLVGVYAGSTCFDHWLPQGKVLWPPHLDNDYYESNKRKLIRLLGGGNFIGTVIDDIVIKVLELIEDIKKNNQEPPYADYSDRIQNLIARVVQANINQTDVAAIENNANQFGTFIDDYSVVFSIGTPNESALFLSDLHEPTMNKMVDDMANHENNDKYTFVKSAHHGTRLSKKLFYRFQSNSLQIIVHSCGEGKGRSLQPDHKKMTYKYSHLPNIAQIDCTSWKKAWLPPSCPWNQFSTNCQYYPL